MVATSPCNAGLKFSMGRSSFFISRAAHVSEASLVGWEKID